MRTFILLLLTFLAFTSPALAQEGLAKLKEQWYKNGGGSNQSMASFIAGSSCNEYITCQGDSFNSESFGYGDIWKTKVNCSTCAGDSKRGLLREVVEAGYQIIETKPSGNTVKIVLQKSLPLNGPQKIPTAKTSQSK